MERIFEVIIDKILKGIAKVCVESASFFWLYEPDMPKHLKEKVSKKSKIDV